ncbi:F-box/FBD/LRR-repeat protein At1g13570-like isoform X2 [Tasmannia lanceolata]|uniref:F-box/FBD/LRR-repeat protein At1g13570-like isoform X2 n=1 Tax=Tasmannia lanceolata TaxID=3420 RepID=UPI004063C292
MHRVLGCLRNVEVLVMHNQFLQDLAVGDVPEMVLNTLGHLKNLSLDMDFGNRKETLAILCMLRSSHHLQKLKIKVCCRDSDILPEYYCWEEQEHKDWMLKHLRTVKMINMYGSNLEIEFIRLLLVNSPVLKTLTIKTAIEDFEDEVMVLAKLIRFRRASVQAEILYSA